MPSTNLITTLLIRALIGIVVGVILGLIIEPIFFWSEPSGDGQVRLPVAGPIFGAAICCVLLTVFGGMEFPKIAKHLTINILLGIIAGVLIGATLFPTIMTAIDALGQATIRSKAFGVFQQMGILLGIPIGALAGLVIAFVRRQQ